MEELWRNCGKIVKKYHSLFFTDNKIGLKIKFIIALTGDLKTCLLFLFSMMPARKPGLYAWFSSLANISCLPG
jgi:hypothetical protein